MKQIYIYEYIHIDGKFENLGDDSESFVLPSRLIARGFVCLRLDMVTVCRLE